MTKKITSSVLLGLSTLSVLFLFNNCGDGFKQSGKMMHYDGSSTGGTPPPAPNPANKVTLATTQANNTSELNRTFRVPVIIDRTGTFATKTLELKINSPEIDSLDPANGFSATITPSTLPPGVNMAEVTVNIGTAAPSLVEHFHVEAWDGAQIEAELTVNLTIQPVIRIQVRNTLMGDANWSSNGVPIANLFMAGTRDVPFVHHPAPGLQVIFENLSTTNGLVVHSSGSIPHGNIGTPLTVSADGATPTPTTGVYMPARIIGNQRLNAPVYSHTNEAGGAARTLRFNINL